MRASVAAAVSLLFMLVCSGAQAQEQPAFERNLRKLVRSEQMRHRSAEATASGGSFAGRWSGRFSFLPSSSTCSTSVTSISFQHLVSLRGRSASLSTDHAGSFSGSSRDGRTYIFTKIVNTNVGYFVVGVGYGGLSLGGRQATIVHLIHHVRTGCEFAYGTIANR